MPLSTEPRYRIENQLLTADQACKHFRPEVFSLARKLTRNPEEAEDLTQEVMYRLLKCLPSIQKSPGPWLQRAVQNLSIDHWRARKVRNEVSLEELWWDFLYKKGVIPTMEDSYEVVARRLLGEAIRVAIAELPKIHSDVLTLDLLDEVDQPVIAKQIGCKLNTVKTRCFRGKIWLRRKLQMWLDYPV